MRLRRRALLATTLLPSAAAFAQPDQGWRPERSIRAIVPFAPGGLADLMARLVSERAAPLLGQPIAIENRTGGAAGLIGTDLAAKAAPDGYTIVINSSAQAIAPALVARMPYDAAADFAGIAVLGGAPMVLVGHPSLPARNMQELLALLRANPGKFNYAGAGNGSTVHLTGEVFRAAAKVEIQFVHYRGGGPALQAVMSGEAHLTGVSVAEAASQVRNGTVRAFALSGPQRSPVLAEVPTSAEAGLPGFQQDIWVIAAAPVRTPPPIVAALNAAYNAAARQIEPKLAELGLEIRADVVTPAQVDAFLRKEIERYAAVLRAAGVKPE
ncbi:ABC transporter substrate-binding protein [Siccirubricoccus deserti]|uniref:Tripartite tricarboxylate transporter substrate binding protein n=1 Tax=Siccirubricoccus deserti TaxID=2013562 RepID=A0A9X0R4U7_9PROT|nr:tripartite tricarboxylate transporter substrate-binding protein [Siccirubricoccus deserti]MBC4018908.1 tripartite tricarboxylate transporter substrate binding protein [Siccirubricoccus deserti]GGC69477.1 ABC transporter substrate-binding protein [Siccirubricoccus deserti]